MRYFLITCLACITFSCTYGQDFKVLDYTESNPLYPEDRYQFPLLNGDDIEVTIKINAHLILEQLDLVNGEQQASIFENVWRGKEEPMARINNMTYKVESLTSKVYSVTISAEFCNAYCEPYDISYTYNLRNGNMLTLDSLFTPEGAVQVLQMINNNKAQIISNKLQQINSLLSLNLAQVDQDTYTEMREMYAECNTQLTSLEHVGFKLQSGKIVMVANRCSAHYNRSIDELWYFVLELKTDDLQQQLSALGKNLLIE